MIGRVLTRKWIRRRCCPWAIKKNQNELFLFYIYSNIACWFHYLAQYFRSKTFFFAFSIMRQWAINKKFAHITNKINAHRWRFLQSYNERDPSYSSLFIFFFFFNVVSSFSCRDCFLLRYSIIVVSAWN